VTANAPPAANAIDLTDLHKRFAGQSRDVISGLNLSLPHHSCLSLLGPSGCGKTTLLRLLMGLELPSSGVIQVDPALAGNMAYVFQEPRLVPWRTALENVLLPLELLRRDVGGQRDTARELLQRLGLEERMHHFPQALSGGMQMRVALARALVTRPRMLLLDEPFAALDERTRFRLQDLLLELRTTFSLQYVFVTHSISEAIYLGDSVLLLDRHGREALATPVMLGPRTQEIKLGAEFNALARGLSHAFASIEQTA